MLEYQTSVPQNVALFEETVFPEVIEYSLRSKEENLYFFPPKRVREREKKGGKKKIIYDLQIDV